MGLSEKLKKLTVEYNMNIVCLFQVNTGRRKVEKNNIIWNTTDRWREKRCAQGAYHKYKLVKSEHIFSGTTSNVFRDTAFIISNQRVYPRNIE